MRKGHGALWLAGALACGNEPAATLAPAGEPEPKAPPAGPAEPLRSLPGHDFERSGSEPAHIKATEGTMAATVDGDPVRFAHLPLGANAVVLAGPGGVSRVTVTGQETTEPFPQLQVYLSGIRIDELKLPATLTSAASADRTVEVRFARAKDVTYVSEAGQATVVLEAFGEGRLRGTVEGTLASTRGGAPARIARGTFDVAVRVRDSRPAP